MKKLNLTTFFILFTFGLFSQIIPVDSLPQEYINYKDSTKKKNFLLTKPNQQEAVWDNGVPILPDDENIMGLVTELNSDAITDVNKLTKEQVRIYRELGIEF